MGKNWTEKQGSPSEGKFSPSPIRPWVVRALFLLTWVSRGPFELKGVGTLAGETGRDRGCLSDISPSYRRHPPRLHPTDAQATAPATEWRDPCDVGEVHDEKCGAKEHTTRLLP